MNKNVYPGVKGNGDGPVGWDLIPRGKKVKNGKLVNKLEEETPMNIKKGQLKELIKQIVRESLRERKKLEEASYKIVSKTQARVQKDDLARKVQTDPEVNEASYKVQGPGAKTCDDGLQLPDAINDPRNA